MGHCRGVACCCIEGCGLLLYRGVWLVVVMRGVACCCDEGCGLLLYRGVWFIEYHDID